MQANNFYKKLGFELRLETYDVFGVKKGEHKGISVEGIEDKKFIAKTADNQPCRYVLTGSVYQVYDKDVLEEFDYERCHPARGYFKQIK